MQGRPWYRFTILQITSCACVVGCVAGLLLRSRDALDLTLGLLLFAGPSLVAAHLAIEANRRDSAEKL